MGSGPVASRDPSLRLPRGVPIDKRRLAPTQRGFDYAASSPPVSQPHPASSNRDRHRSDHHGSRPGAQRPSFRSERHHGFDLGDDRKDHATDHDVGGRRARRVGQRAAVEQLRDHRASGLEPDQGRQQRFRVHAADPGALLQGRGVLRACELQLVAGVHIVGYRRDPRLQERRRNDPDRLAQRRIHSLHAESRRPVGYDDRFRRRRSGVLHDHVQQVAEAAERDDGDLRHELFEPKLSPRRRGRGVRDVFDGIYGEQVRLELGTRDECDRAAGRPADGELDPLGSRSHASSPSSASSASSASSPSAAASPAASASSSTPTTTAAEHPD